MTQDARTTRKLICCAYNHGVTQAMHARPSTLTIGYKCCYSIAVALESDPLENDGASGRQLQGLQEYLNHQAPLCLLHRVSLYDLVLAHAIHLALRLDQMGIHHLLGLLGLPDHQISSLLGQIHKNYRRYGLNWACYHSMPCYSCWEG